MERPARIVCGSSLSWRLGVLVGGTRDSCVQRVRRPHPQAERPEEALDYIAQLEPHGLHLSAGA